MIKLQQRKTKKKLSNIVIAWSFINDKKNNTEGINQQLTIFNTLIYIEIF